MGRKNGTLNEMAVQKFLAEALLLWYNKRVVL